MKIVELGNYNALILQAEAVPSHALVTTTIPFLVFAVKCASVM